MIKKVSNIDFFSKFHKSFDFFTIFDSVKANGAKVSTAPSTLAAVVFATTYHECKYTLSLQILLKNQLLGPNIIELFKSVIYGCSK
jgi:hypothetical protein